MGCGRGVREEDGVAVTLGRETELVQVAEAGEVEVRVGAAGELVRQAANKAIIPINLINNFIARSGVNLVKNRMFRSLVVSA